MCYPCRRTVAIAHALQARTAKEQVRRGREAAAHFSPRCLTGEK